MHSVHALSGPGHVWKPLQRSRLLSPFQKLVSWICPNNHSLFTLLPYLQLGSCWGIWMTRLCVLFGEGGPEESHSYRLTPQPQRSPCAERRIPGEAMPLPLTLAFAAEQTLTGNITLACKDAPALLLLYSSAHSMQGAFYLLRLVCDIWFFFLMAIYLPPAKGIIFFLFLFYFFSLFFFFFLLLWYPEDNKQQSQNRSKFQHILLLFSFRTILFQPSDLQQTA